MQLDQETFERWKAQAVPVAALMNDRHGLSREYRDTFKGADLIVGYDTARPGTTDSMTVFHGRGALQDIAHSGRAQPLKVMVVAYDQNSTWPEALAACCLVHRDGCDLAQRNG